MNPSIVDLTLRYLGHLADGRKVPGLAVGILRDNRSWVLGLGRVAGEGSEVPNGPTVFEIGSVSKVYTAVLLAEMVERGEVAFDDPVQSLLPDGVTVPSRSTRAISLQHLATHTSGLPRLPDNLPVFNLRDPYAAYTIDGLYAFLARHQLSRDPGEKAEYSNLGMGLLGHALACRAGISYEDLITERIARPLGMVDTVRTLDPARAARLAAPHNDKGKPSSNWELRTLAGAGGLRSTVDDQLRLLSACLHPDDTSTLGRALINTLNPRADLGRDGLKIGLGWVLPPSGGAWHNGQTGGYASFLAVRLDPRGGVGLVVLANASTNAIDEPSAELLADLTADE